MAEQPRNLSCSEEQIQSMVRGILGEMLQSEQSVQPVVQQFDSVEREINQRFRLPRNNVDNANELRASSSDAVSNATTQSHSTHVSNSMTVSAPCQTGVPFNPMVNYGFQPRPGPIRPRRSGSRRLQPLNQRQKSQSDGGNVSSLTDRNAMFLKDVCLLPNATCDKVPRREVKAQLQNDGFYIDAFTFDKKWDEKILREKIMQLFSTVLKSETR